MNDKVYGEPNKTFLVNVKDAGDRGAEVGHAQFYRLTHRFDLRLTPCHCEQEGPSYQYSPGASHSMPYG